VLSIESTLRAEGKIVQVVIATGGLPSDSNGFDGPIIINEFLQCLVLLKSLPVWIVVRLSTEDDDLTNFYNTLDAHIPFQYDVLDDFIGESLEVHLRNPWLNYGLPLHRIREMGASMPTLDHLDNRPSSLNEIRNICLLLFTPKIAFPDANVNLPSFLNAIKNAMAYEVQQWNPVTKTLAPWIDLSLLEAIYSEGLPRPRRPLPNNQGQDHYVSQNQPFGTYSSYEGHQQNNQTQKQFFESQQQNYSNKASSHQHQSQIPTQQNHQHVTHPQYDYCSKSQFVNAPVAENQQPCLPPIKPLYDASIDSNTGRGASETDLSLLKKNILMNWALLPPNYQTLHPLKCLLITVHNTFPPAFGVETHDYFQKWNSLSLLAFQNGEKTVLKRATRKLKFFLHPDKLPKNLTQKQSHLFRTLWDVISDVPQ